MPDSLEILKVLDINTKHPIIFPRKLRIFEIEYQETNSLIYKNINILKNLESVCVPLGYVRYLPKNIKKLCVNVNIYNKYDNLLNFSVFENLIELTIINIVVLALICHYQII